MEEILGGGILGIGASKLLKDKDKDKPVTKKTKKSKTPEITPPEGKGPDIVSEIVAETAIERMKEQGVEGDFSDYEYTGEETLDDLYRLEEEGIIKRDDWNVFSPRYDEYLDAQIVKRDKLYTAKEWANTPDTIKNKVRAALSPDWAEARFGDDWHEVLDKQRTNEIKQTEMFEDFDVKGRKKNATGGRIGFQDGEGIMSRVGDMVDVRNVPYYSGKALQGLVNSAETLSKFPFAAGKLGSQLIQQPPKKEMFMDAIENITPGSWSENLGLTSLVEGMGEKRPKDAQTVGNLLGLGTEVAVPTGGAFKAGQFLLNKVSKLMGKVKDGKTLNKLVDEKLTDSGQSRRDFNIMAITMGIGAAFKSVGLGGLFKAATKKLDDIEIQVRGDADYSWEGPESGWEGGTWANVYFKALSKKGKKILDDWTKKRTDKVDARDNWTDLTYQDGLYVPGGGSEEAAYLVEKIIAKSNPNWRLNTATKQIYDKKTKSFVHPKGSEKGAYEHNKSYSGKDLNKKNIMDEADDIIASEPSPYHGQTIVHDEYFDDILDQITTKKAEGGRIGLGTGGPPLQFGIAEAEWKAKHPVQGNKISQLKDAAMDKAFPGTGITGSLNMGNFEAFYNQPLIDPMNMFEKSENPQYGLQYEKGPFEAGIGVMPSGETEYGARFKKNIDFNKMLGVHNRRRQANGGLTKTIPPERGPDPQGLPSALYNGIMRPRSY